MVESYTIFELVEMLKSHSEKFAPEISNRLSIYVLYSECLTGYSLHAFLESYASKYIGYQTYSINGASITLDYLAVDPDHQRQGIGLKLASLAIDEGLKAGCKKVESKISNAAKPLFVQLTKKYPQLEFVLSETGHES